MAITLDRQAVAQSCPDCGGSFTVIRGSVYDDGAPCGLYLIALHGHSPDGRLAHLAVALVDPAKEAPHPLAAAVVVTERPDQFDCQFVPGAESPWSGEAYLGEMLEPDMARHSPHRERFFAVADRAIGDLPEVADYFGR
jgi:hypothetical protein